MENIKLLFGVYLMWCVGYFQYNLFSIVMPDVIAVCSSIVSCIFLIAASSNM